MAYTTYTTDKKKASYMEHRTMEYISASKEFDRLENKYLIELHFFTPNPDSKGFTYDLDIKLSREEAIALSDRLIDIIWFNK